MDLISYVLKAALVLYLVWSILLVAAPKKMHRFYQTLDQKLIWNPYRQMLKEPGYFIRIRHSGLILLSPWVLAITWYFVFEAIYNATH